MTGYTAAGDLGQRITGTAGGAVEQTQPLASHTPTAQVASTTALAGGDPDRRPSVLHNQGAQPGRLVDRRPDHRRAARPRPAAVAAHTRQQVAAFRATREPPPRPSQPHAPICPRRLVDPAPGGGRPPVRNADMDHTQTHPDGPTLGWTPNSTPAADPHAAAAADESDNRPSTVETLTVELLADAEAGGSDA